MRNKYFYNVSGYSDPTAYIAIKNIERDEAKQRLKRLIKTLKAAIAKNGFALLNNIELKDIESGIVFTETPKKKVKR
jgi:hypothetical protein